MNFAISRDFPVVSSANEDVSSITRQYNQTFNRNPAISDADIYAWFPEFMVEELIEVKRIKGTREAAVQLALHFVIANEIICRVEEAGGTVHHPPFIYTDQGFLPPQEHWELLIGEKVVKEITWGNGVRA